MSPRISTTIAALLAIAALPAASAVAKSSQHQSAVKTADESASILKPSSGLGHVRSTSAPLSLARDRKVNAAKLRGVKAAPRSARRHHRLTIASNKSVDARVLLLAGTGLEPTFVWWKTMLAKEGVPFDAIITADADPITTATLQTSATQGKYEAVVLATGTLSDCTVSPCADTMGPDAWTALQTYEKDFAIREIGAYGWPSPAYGTNWGGDCGDKSQNNLTVTAAGAATFGDLAGSFPTDKAVWGCETTALPGSSWQTLVAGPKGAVVGTSIRTDGVETMFNSIDGSDWTIHSQLLFHGMLNWVTKGIYLGTHRNYFKVDVDDIFLGNDRWDPATKTLNPDESTIIRMVPSDVLRAIQWEQSTGIRLNLLFNADAADPAGGNATSSSSSSAFAARGVIGNGATNTNSTRQQQEQARKQQEQARKEQARLAQEQARLAQEQARKALDQARKAQQQAAKAKQLQGDPLTNALLLTRGQFDWTSHTFTHADLDAADGATIVGEVKNNIAFAKKYGLNINASELTTGGHSGLANAAMPQALTDAGVKSIGSDASRGMDSTVVGSATTLPRYPTGIYYNVGTKAEQLDEYNYLNYTVCVGTGNPGCLGAPVDWNGYVNNEATMILRHILGNDPRPHYVHQANLAEDGTLYPVADELLRRYKSYLKTPLVQPTYTDASAILAQQTAWSSALAAGTVSATISATGMSVTSKVANLMVPVTGIKGQAVYGGIKTGWQKLAVGTTQLGL
jgi:hypothetical protein